MSQRFSMRWVALFFLLLVDAAFAGEVVWRRGEVNVLSDEVVVEDVALADSLPGANGGAFPQLAVGRSGGRRTLIRFDLRPLKGKIGRLERATLYLSAVSKEKLKPVRVQVLAVSQANRDWLEGAGRFVGLAEEGEPCWRFKASPSLRWEGGPGLLGEGEAGEPVVEFDSEVEGRMEVALPVAHVWRWIEHPEENGGLLLVAPESEGSPELTMLVHSSEADEPEVRPALHLVFEP